MLPRAKHCKPEAMAKRVGVGDERRIACTPPVRRPAVPSRMVSNQGGLSGSVEDGVSEPMKDVWKGVERVDKYMKDRQQ